jgi:hypothetical protein
MRSGDFDNAEAGAAQGRVNADDDAHPAGRVPKAALKDRLRDAFGAAQAGLELLELPGCNGHGDRWRGIQFSLFTLKLKTKISRLANLFHFQSFRLSFPWKKSS